MATSKIKTTEKQERFIIEKLKGKSNRRAAIDAGYSENTATNASTDILTKPGTIEGFRRAMEEAGITDKKLADVLSDGLNKKVDANTKLNYTKYINEMRGLAPKKGVDVTSGGEPLSFSWEE